MKVFGFLMVFKKCVNFVGMKLLRCCLVMISFVRLVCRWWFFVFVVFCLLVSVCMWVM